MSQAMPRGALDVYLNNELLGAINDRTMGFVAFDFSEPAIERYGIDSRVLSLSIPVSWDTVDPLVATPFFAGLLPEGDARTRLCEEFRISPDDPFALLTVLGRESAGALVIVPAGEAPQSTDEIGVRALDDDTLAAELDRLALAPLGVTVDDDEIRLSLAGVQEKLPLVRIDGGRLGLPLHGHPSTHIAKPARRTDRFPELVQNEAFCLGVAAALDIPTAAFSVIAPAGSPVLLVERYDRTRNADGTIVRLHQEDVCQATGHYPATKYEIAGGPSLAAVADLIGSHSSQPAIDRMTLLRLTALNAAIGNCDAHGKNLSFLHDPDGVRLAPAYDLVSTAAYQHTDQLGMRIGGVDRLRDIDHEALLVQAEAIGVPRRLGERIVGEFAEAFPTALDAARERAVAEGWLAPVVDRVIAASRDRAERFLGVAG